MKMTSTMSREIRKEAEKSIENHTLLMKQIDRYIRESADMSDRLVVQLLNLKAMASEARDEAISKLNANDNPPAPPQAFAA